MTQRNHFELANGTKGRSGEQIDIWSAVFGPLGDDGYFKPLFDKYTGEIDPDVAQAWNTKGAALIQLGRLREARKAFERALDIAPGLQEAQHNLRRVRDLAKGAR